jgi:hypothetical protein
MYYSTLYSTIVTLNTLIVTYVFRLVYNTLYSPGLFPDAYGHEWACQLVYNPRMCISLGLSDGEGTERLWSRFVRLIGVERSSSVCFTFSSKLSGDHSMPSSASVVYG